MGVATWIYLRLAPRPGRTVTGGARLTSSIAVAPIIAVLVSAAGCVLQPPGPHTSRSAADVRIDSLETLSLDALRSRSYGTELHFEQWLDRSDASPQGVSRQDAARHGETFMASYDSDGLRLYTRVDIPVTAVPAAGYPVVVFLHGWAGIEAAPGLDFYVAADSGYGATIRAYREAGFVVLAPGFRGHGTVMGRSAEGIEFLAAWDNGSYLSPIFYAIDAINLIEGVSGTGQIHKPSGVIRIDRKNISVMGHSQGGDVALIVAAVAGEGSAVNAKISSVSIWSGTFPSRIAQLETYYPMQTTREAFMSGDGSWNGSSAGADGVVNPNFVFGYPPDWIGSVNPDEWTWQKETWALPDVASAFKIKLDQMYDAVNRNVDDIDNARYRLKTDMAGKVHVVHDARVGAQMKNLGAFNGEAYLSEPLALHHSDRDFYSLPSWNADLCRRVNAAGGRCQDFDYPGNTHSLRRSSHAWFSGDTTVAGFDLAIRRDIVLFGGGDPAGVAAPR